MYTKDDANESYIGKCDENNEIFKPNDSIYYCLEHGKWLCCKCKDKHEGDAMLEYKLIVFNFRKLETPHLAKRTL